MGLKMFKHDDGQSQMTKVKMKAKIWEAKIQLRRAGNGFQSFRLVR